ncbi:MAG TPA: hypothetical protein VFX17_02115 [Patescibacteria group bacterium]|nr:hypothetical protein [Patescibacteria group bacterium]
MPVLQDFRNTKLIVLPSYPDSKVEIFDSLLVGELAKFSGRKIGTDEERFELGLDVLPKLIKSWNFTDESGQPLLITKENLSFLKKDDIEYITSEVTKFLGENKKKDETNQQSV